jgi:pimeloyl-ACP methyl ester carboxylesterase
MNDFTRQRLALPTGVELDVHQSGDPAGVPLLLLHGYTDTAGSMLPLMERLPPGVRAIAVTQRGHGDSSKAAGYAMTDFAADAAAVLDRLGVSRAVVYGHSMGSVIAQRFALAHPRRTAALILEGGAPGFAGNAVVAEFYETAIKELRDPIDPAFARAFQLSAVAKPPAPGFLDMAVAETCKLPAAAWKAIGRAMMAERLDAELSRIAAPTLLLWGELDAFVGREDQDRLLAGLSRAELKAFPDLGHSPHWEDPARTAALIGPFTLRHGARTPVPETTP